jgi:geranylgeranyl pyrophosphate synthase
LKAIVPPDSELLADSLQHSLSGGGKFIRPVITLLSGLALGGVIPALVETAAVSEMIHIATLLHDDVLDDAAVRRGRETVRNRWGNTVSILAGDYLLAQASLKLAQIGNITIVGLYSQVLADLCDGEVEQIRSSYQLATPWESYFRKSICKTASLFATGCEAAAVLHQLPEAERQRLKDFGRNFGLAFQIVDDALDYTASQEALGKPVLDDLRNGLMNAPVLLALENTEAGSAAQTELRGLVQTIFDAGRQNEPIAEEVLLRTRELILSTGGIDRTLRLAREHVKRAVDALSFLPASEAKQALESLATTIIERSN